jgi:hypothetical protein
MLWVALCPQEWTTASFVPKDERLRDLRLTREVARTPAFGFDPVALDFDPADRRFDPAGFGFDLDREFNGDSVVGP